MGFHTGGWPPAGRPGVSQGEIQAARRYLVMISGPINEFGNQVDRNGI